MNEENTTYFRDQKTSRIMLRDDYCYGGTPEFRQVLLCFEGVNDETLRTVIIEEFKQDSPDSFLWRLHMEGAVYYLYAEDYVSGLHFVKEHLNDITGKKGEFIPVKQPVAFGSSEPVNLATTYKQPDDWNDISKYAAGSGYDFVFLYKVVA